MLNINKKIEQLMKFIIKTLNVAIETGNNLIQAYNSADKKIERLKLVIGKLIETKKELEK